MDSSSSVSNSEMYSITDYSPYNLPVELSFGKLRSTTEFARLEQLGDGSSSSVFKARDNKSSEYVALKFLKRQDKEHKLRKNVFREITLLKLLDHNNVIKMHSVAIGSNINDLCLVLDYCVKSVGSFIETFNAQKIPQSQVKCVASQMLRGLSYLHKNFIIHRDLSPSNLMVTQSGIIKIIDFGLSRKFTHKLLPMSPTIQSRWYEAPEILLQAPYYDQSVDMWSVACIIMELLLKKPLLPGQSEINQITLIIDLFGTPTPNIWPDYVHCRLPKSVHLKEQSYNRLSEKLNSIGCCETLDFFNELFLYNPQARSTADECLEHEWMIKAPYPSKFLDLNPPMMPLEFRS